MNKSGLNEQRIDFVFPTTDSLVAEFATWSHSHSRFITQTAEIGQLLTSKHATYRRLADLVPTPTVYSKKSDVVFPAYAKPDDGAGSRAHMILHNEQDLAAAVAKGLLLTEYLPGEEYTVDCLSTPSGDLLSASVRKRSKIGRGIALSAMSISEPTIEQYTQAIAQALKLRGPWFAQFKRSAKGTPTLLEVNGRVAGSMSTTRLLGINIPLASVFLYAGYAVSLPTKHNVCTDQKYVVNRCLFSLGATCDFGWVIWDLDDTIIRKDGKPDPELIASLYDCHNRGKRQVLLTRNVDPHGAIKVHNLPDIFVSVCRTTDKCASLRELMATYAFTEDAAVMVNDSYTERLELNRRHPQLRVISPDAVEVLGRETLE